ncbi:MAG: endonuclease III [Bacteroidota bacterium]|nr:endonuclease III [Bacteroidota bacterium]
MTKKERYEKVIEYFLENRPDAETELIYANPYELAVAVILSAQCTDKRVNMITPAFFKRFPNTVSLASATPEEVIELIKSCSYPNNKARNLIGMAKALMEKFEGVMPSGFEDLLSLPGIGRKSANVISSVAFRKPAMAVDTHVFRVSARIGLTYRARNPYQTEMQLVKNIPEKYISIAHHWLILHGRYICQARKPKCGECGLTGVCKYYNHLKKD